jgi:hypothetical protein
MKIPAIDCAKNKFAAGAYIASLIDRIKGNFFFTTSTLSPIAHCFPFLNYFNGYLFKIIS